MSEPEPRAHADRLSVFFATPIPDAPPHPDAALLDLAEQALAALVQHKLHLNAHLEELYRWAPPHGTAPDAFERAFGHLFQTAEAHHNRATPLLRRAQALTARTPAGIMAKAVLIRASKYGAPALARSLAIDLINSPTLRAAVWPAQ